VFFLPVQSGIRSICNLLSPASGLFPLSLATPPNAWQDIQFSTPTPVVFENDFFLSVLLHPRDPYLRSPLSVVRNVLLRELSNEPARISISVSEPFFPPETPYVGLRRSVLLYASTLSPFLRKDALSLSRLSFPSSFFQGAAPLSNHPCPPLEP